jgi:hypothetical protein
MADEEYQELGAEEVEHAIDDLAGIDNVRRMDGWRVLERVELLMSTFTFYFPSYMQDEDIEQMKQQLENMEKEAAKLQEMQVRQFFGLCGLN